MKSNERANREIEELETRIEMINAQIDNLAKKKEKLKSTIQERRMESMREVDKD